MTETEDVTVPTLLAVTAVPGGMFWRQQAGTFRTMDGKRVVRVSANGVADIMGAYRGYPIAIETKTATGTMRETQKNFRAAWTRAGGVYIIARSPEAALLALSALA